MDAKRLPTQKQLVLPLLDALEAAGGTARTRDLAKPVAEAAGVDESAMKATIDISGERRSWFRHRMRWAQQLARVDGLVERDGDAWTITGKGRRTLTRAQPGQVVTLFTTGSGVFLFGLAEDAVGHVEDGSVACVWTSPPYPLITQKAYGDPYAAGVDHVDWLESMVESWLPKLDGDDASIVLNLGDAWLPGMPSISTYQERLVVRLEDRLGLRLAQRLAWHNPSAPPGPTLWTCIRRVRLKQSLENLWWFSRSGHARADNRRVLVPYSGPERTPDSRERRMRPSGRLERGHILPREHGGAIPSNLLSVSNGGGDRRWMARCRAAGLPVHPARFPEKLARFVVGLTTEEGETVLDPFAGSGTTARVCEDMGRRWIGVEAVREYAEGARLRFAA